MALLTSAEERLYRDQEDVDRRHSIECALRIREALGPHATRPIVVASALHDVGKAGTRLGTVGRAVATMVGKILSDSTTESWLSAAGSKERVGRYLHHGELGATMLAGAGSHPTVVAWAREHHNPSIWSIEARTARALRDADH